MPFLVDGDNLLGTWPDRRRTDDERRGLAFELARFAANSRRRVVVAFDGGPPCGLEPGLDVYYSGFGRTADELILARLRREVQPREWIVVTSDRALGDRCRFLGARVERSDRFRKRLLEPTRGEKPEREEDVDYWLGQFEPD